ARSNPGLIPSRPLSTISTSVAGSDSGAGWDNDATPLGPNAPSPLDRRIESSRRHRWASRSASRRLHRRLTPPVALAVSPGLVDPETGSRTRRGAVKERSRRNRARGVENPAHSGTPPCERDSAADARFPLRLFECVLPLLKG